KLRSGWIVTTSVRMLARISSQFARGAGTLAKNRCGLNGAATMKIINKTRSTSISGVTLINGFALLSSLICVPPACEEECRFRPATCGKVPAPLRSLHVLQAVNHYARHRGNDLALVGMVGCKRCEDKLRAVGRLDVSDIVARGAGPTRLGPETITFGALQRDGREAVSLIVRIGALTGVIALQEFHHRGGARRAGGLAGHDLHHQARGGVGGQLVAVFAVWTTRDAFASVCVFAERLLVHVDVGVTE